LGADWRKWASVQSAFTLYIFAWFGINIALPDGAGHRPIRLVISL
jgi:hypothetical protein